jgi:hypothetical protein
MCQPTEIIVSKHAYRVTSDQITFYNARGQQVFLFYETFLVIDDGIEFQRM